MQHSHKFGLCGPKILTQLQTLRVILEEACVQCFNLIKLVRAKGMKAILKQVNVEASFVPGVASSTDQAAMRYWCDRASTSISVSKWLQWCLYCKIKPNSGNQFPLAWSVCVLMCRSWLLCWPWQLFISFSRAEIDARRRRRSAVAAARGLPCGRRVPAIGLHCE